MKSDKKMVLILLSFLAAAHCTDLQQTGNGGVDETQNHAETANDSLTAAVSVGGDHPESHDEPMTVVASSLAAAAATGASSLATTTSSRSARQFYQPSAYAYQPMSWPQRRAYKGPGKSKKRPMRTKSRRPGSRPRRRPSQAGPPRYRRLPPQPVRPQHVNYIDGGDYDDGYESMPSAAVASSFDYSEREFLDDPSLAYGNSVQYGPHSVPGPMAVLSSGGARLRKRPVGFVTAADEVIHVPMRVARPAALTVAPPLPTPQPTTTTTSTASTVDPMEKLRQLVHEAMDEHFANRHQELYTDGFDKHVYSAKYKRQPSAVDRDKFQRADAVKPSSTPKKDAADVDADSSEGRLTLAEISAYMGAKPAETVLSAGGHRYVLSDALQQQQQVHDHQQQQVYVDETAGGAEQHHQYLRYVSPFEAIYEMPARWTYK